MKSIVAVSQLLPGMLLSGKHVGIARALETTVMVINRTVTVAP